MYIPGRKANTTDPFSAFVLIQTTASPEGYRLTKPPFNETIIIHAGLPQVDPPIRPYKIFMDIALPDGTKDTRLVTDWSPYLHTKRGAHGADIRIFSIPGIKSIFPGPMLHRNVIFTNIGLSEKQLNPITFPLAAPCSKQQGAAASALTSLSAISAVAVSVPVTVPVTATTTTGTAAATTSSVKPPITIKKKILDPSAYGRALNPYIARQLLEFAQMKGEVCPITAGPFEDNDSVVMPCGHVFSRLAITESFKTQHGKCPACRLSGSPTYI